MKKFRKLLCVILSVIMVITVFPLTLLAATGVQSGVTADDSITTNVCTIWYMKDGVETKYKDYATLDAAFEGLRDLYVDAYAAATEDTDNDGNLNNELYAAAGSPVIKLNGNFQGGYVRPNWATDKNVPEWVGYSKNKVPTIVIDGAKNANENYTITYGTSSAPYNDNTFNHLAYYNLTVRNTNMVINSGANTFDGNFCWAGNSGMADPGESFTVFENCVIKQNSTVTSGSGTLFKMNGKAKYNADVNADPYTYDKYNLILRDTHVEAAVGLGHQAHWGVDANIELHNSSMGLVDVGGDNANNNDALLKFYEAGVGRVYVDGTSKLFSRREDSGATVALIRVLNNQKANVTVELEAGAELAMMNTVALTDKTYIADGGKGMTTLIDNGAIYSASAIDAKTGVNLPTALKDATWIAGDGVSVDASTGKYTGNGTYGAVLTTSAKSPITVKKDGAVVNAGVTDVNAAFDYVYSQADSEKYVIYLNDNISVGDYMNPETYSHTDVRTVTIDGQNNSLWAYNPTATFYGIGLYNLKLSNLELVYAGDQAASLDWSPRKTPSDNYGNYIATGSNPVVDTQAVFTNVVGRPAHEFIAAGNFKLKGGNSGTQNKGTYGIRLVDSEFTSTLDDTMFMMNDAGNLDLDVIGTTINYIGGASNNDGNNYIFALNGAKVDINVENSANNVSVLRSASRSTRVTSGIFNNGTGYAVNVTFAKDVELYLTANNSKTNAKFFSTEKATTTITDNGAKWIVGKDLLDNGAKVYLPRTMFGAEYVVWYKDGKAATIPYVDANATADAVFTNAAAVEKAPGVQSEGTGDAQLGSAVCTIWYMKDGVETKQADYASVDAAFEGLRARYVGPLADTTLTDTNGNGLSDELYEAAGSPVIKLNGNFQSTYARPNWATNNGDAQIKYDMNKVITIVIDGAKNENENYTMTYGTSSSAYSSQTFNYLAYYNLTVKNTNFVINSGGNAVDGIFLWQGNSNDGGAPGTSHTVFENCAIRQIASTTGGSGSLFKMNGKAKFDATVTSDPCLTDKYNLILKDTTVEISTGIGHQAHWGADANIELYNSVMGLVGAAGDASNNNDALLKFYEAGVGRVYLDGTSRLYSGRTTANTTTALIRVNSNQKSAVSVELEAGAELAMMNIAALKNKTYIADGGKGMTTLIDNGAIYSASAIDAKTGVNLPTALTSATWIAGDGVSVDASTGNYTGDGNYGVVLTTAKTAPITVKKDGEVVKANVKDINAAFDYVYSQADSEKYVIYLNNNMSVGEYMNPANYTHTAIKTVTIDGQSNTLTSHNGTATFYGIGLFNLVVRNANLRYAVNQAASLDWSPRLTTSDAYANYIATGSNPVEDTFSSFANVTSRPYFGITAGSFKLKGGNSGTQNKGAYGIRLVDSEFTSTLADTMFMMNDAGNLDLDVIGTTINYIGGASNNDGNNYIFALNGAKVDINVENSANNVSVLRSASTSTRAVSGIFHNGTGYAVNVTLAENVELYLTANNSKTTAKFFSTEKATTTITDNGAKWIVGKDLLDNGAAITFPTSIFADSKQDHVWYVGGVAIVVPYSDASAKADVIFTHAEPKDPSEGNVAYILVGETKTYYANLQNAINALGAIYDAVTTENLTDEALWTAAGSPVIYLYDDITITAETYPNWVSDYDANRVRTVVIKSDKGGSNPLITSTVAGAAFSYNAYYNLTLEDIDLNCTQGFALFWRGYNNGNKSAKSTTNLNNCNITATGTSGEGLVFKVTGNQNQTKTENYIINFNNTDVTAKAGVNAVFLFHHGCAGEVNIDGQSTITHTQNKVSAGGDTMFMLGTNRKIEINVASGAKLSATVEKGISTDAYKNTYALFRLENSNQYASADGIKNVINVADGAIFELNAAFASDYNGKLYAIDNNTKNANNIFNIGAVTFKTNEAARTAGTYFFNGAGKYGNGSLLGLEVDGKLYNNKVAINSDSFVATPVFVSFDDYDMLDGASLRLKKGESGIRFTSHVSNDFINYLNGLNQEYSFGTLIAPVGLLSTKVLDHALVTGGNSSIAIDVISTKMQQGFKSGDNTYDNAFHAAVIMPNTVSPESVYALELTARSYLMITYADGSVGYIYTEHDSEKNARSMHEIAENLVNTMPEYENNDVVADILAVMKPGPDEIIPTLFPDATIVQSGTSSKEIVVTGLTEKDTTVNTFIYNYGFEVVAIDNKIEGAKYETLVLSRGSYMVTVYWMESKGEMRIVWELSTAALDALTPNETTGTGTVDMAQIGIDRDPTTDENGNPDLTPSDNPLNGMCYIIKLADGSAIIIDGGFSNESNAANLVKALDNMNIKTENGKYVISSWIFTHGHGDHIGTFRRIASQSESHEILYYDRFDIESFMFNIPNSSAVAGAEGSIDALLSDIKTSYPDAKVITPHAGLNYYIGNATIEMLYTPELLYTPGTPLSYYNDTSLIFKVTAGGASAFIYGDAGNAASAVLLERYETSAFESDILQISHHGLYTEVENTELGTGHTWDSIKQVYEATGADYAFLPLHSRYLGSGDDSARNGRYTVMVKWGIQKGYQMAFVMNENDKSWIFGDTVEQAEFDQFVSEGQVTNTITMPVSSVYGYDGVNKITNEQGMVTYLGSNETSVMATVFTLGGGTATLNTNVAVADWTVS